VFGLAVAIMRFVYALAVVLIPTGPIAQEEVPQGDFDGQVECSIAVGGQTFAQGDCTISSVGRRTFRVDAENGYSAELKEQGQYSPAWWSGPVAGAPPTVPLGYLRSNDGCWESNLAVICVAD
jgi:hypothetical protein